MGSASRHPRRLACRRWRGSTYSFGVVRFTSWVIFRTARFSSMVVLVEVVERLSPMGEAIAKLPSNRQNAASEGKERGRGVVFHAELER